MWGSPCLGLGVQTGTKLTEGMQRGPLDLDLHPRTFRPQRLPTCSVYPPHLQAPESDYLDAALITVMQIHLSEPEGDVLLFLTGQEEIETCCQILFERMKSLGPQVCGGGGAVWVGGGWGGGAQVRG